MIQTKSAACLWYEAVDVGYGRRWSLLLYGKRRPLSSDSEWNFELSEILRARSANSDSFMLIAVWREESGLPGDFNGRVAGYIPQIASTPTCFRVQQRDDEENSLWQRQQANPVSVRQRRHSRPQRSHRHTDWCRSRVPCTSSSRFTLSSSFRQYIYYTAISIKTSNANYVMIMVW